jgi:hypothetical protein
MKRWACALSVCLVTLATSGVARADPIRILVAVSHTRGAAYELPLHHAAEDAAHVRDVLTELGAFDPGNATVLRDPTLAQLGAAIDHARALAGGHSADEVTFLFYFSGHGDKDKIHLGDESIAMTDLAERVRTVPAGLRLLVTDACRNYPMRNKGITSEPGFAIAGEAGPDANGVVWLFASGEGEPAQESDDLAGALFTHYWVSGLRGAADANGDGRITLAESYDFAYSQTLLRSAKSSGVPQHPAAMFALREAAPIVMTETFAQRTTLRFPQAADARYLIYALGSHTVLGEIWGSGDRSAAMALPAGKYLVVRRAGDASEAAEVWLSAGQARTLGASDFRPVPEEQVATKGGDLLLRPNELGLEVSAGTSRIADFSGMASVRYGLRFDRWALSLSVGGGLGFQSTSAENVHLSMLGGEATLERRFRLGAPTLGVGLGVAADVIWQTLERTDATAVMMAGYSGTTSHMALASGPVGVARLRLPLGKALWVEAAAHGGVLFTGFDGSPGALWTVSGGLGAGVGF